jgi:endonuclease G, mitochondrial
MQIIDFELKQSDEATQRWDGRELKRATDTEKIINNQFSEVETPERIALNINRITNALVQQGKNYVEAMTATIDNSTVSTTSILDDISRERIIGNSDLMGIQFLERGIAVGRFVGRINIRNNGGQTIGYGTGFMVSPRLMLTNNHVLEDIQNAKLSIIEFDYQLDRRGNRLPVASFLLQPEVFFMTDKALDYTLVAVGEKSIENTPISHYGWNPLIEEAGKILISQPVNIIQHPRGEYKQFVFRENKLVDLLPQFAHYTADTEPGSSGSPVFSDLWEVIALHHAGVPKKDSNGNLIAKDGTIWRNGMDPKNLDWIANEGIRISSLVADVKTKLTLLPRNTRKLAEEMLDKEAPNPLEVKEEAENYKQKPVSYPTQNTLPNLQSSSEASWTIPLQVKIGFGSPQLQIAATTDIPQTVLPVTQIKPVLPATASDSEEAISIDPNYQNRQGYLANFLGNGNKQVDLPILSETMKTQAATNKFGTPANPFELKYHHYSVVMNKIRRLAFFTAVNIDGTKSKSPRREKDQWFIDPRIKKEEQCGKELYEKNPFDQGHLVRRLDPAWGDDDQIVKTANDDTFHRTNCCPQHEDFNQGKNLWAGLEDYILKNADNKDIKVSVFTGPVFADDDSVYRGVKIPKQFWKVAVMVKPNNKLSATAYIISQKDLIANLESDFIFGKYKTFQVPIETIEQLTGLNFGNLKTSQPVLESLVFNEMVADNLISEYSQIKL